MNKLIALVLVSACGHGDGTGFVVDAGSVHTLDAPGPPTRVCGVGASLGGLILGNAEMPFPGNWLSAPTSGPNAGEKVLQIYGQLPSTTPDAIDFLVVELVSENGVFPIGTPVNFDTSATAAAGTTAYAAAARINSDIDKQAAIGTFYWAASGSITVTQLGETAGSVIQGEVMTTSYHEVDQATGVAIADGCTTSLVALKFNVLHQPVFAD